MYTRNYHIQNRKESPDDVVWTPEDDKEVPPGYSGTVMLRENDAPDEPEKTIPEHSEKPELRKRKPVKFAYVRNPPKSEEPTPSPEDNEKTAVPEEPRPECEPETTPTVFQCEKEEKVTCGCDESRCGTPEGCPKRKKPELDTLLLGALMLLLINENADDVLLLILGYLMT